MRGGYRLSGWGGLLTTGLGVGFLWVMGCVWIGREWEMWARSETPVGAWGVLGGVLGGGGLPAGLSSGDWRDLGPRSRDRGYGCLGERSGVFFPLLVFPLPCPG